VTISGASRTGINFKAYPVVTSVSPTSQPAGTFNLTINGRYFGSGVDDRIYWKADMHYVGSGPTVSSNSTQLVCTENITTPGTYVVKVMNLDGLESNGSDLVITSAIPARIDSYLPNDPNNPVQVQVGGSTSISVTFTNTGNTDWSFIAGASVWDANGAVVGDYSRTVSLGAGQQTTVSWSHTVSKAGDYWLQFGVWKDSQTLLDKKPSPSQRLIRGISPCPGKFCIGDIVIVSNNGLGLNLRQCASTNNTSCPVVVVMPDGTQMTVFGGPVQADGYTWWAISGYVSGIYRAGWASEHGLRK
jgi:hypothetical protein